MKGLLTVIASFLIMVCSGSIYGWSVIASRLISNYNFTTLQTQIIFGTTIAIFPVVMILARGLVRAYSPRPIILVAGLCCGTGYLTAGNLSNGNFLMILLGIGFLVSISIGLCYLISLTVPTQWYPNKQGLITGIITAGFGLGAIAFTILTELFMLTDQNILNVLTKFGYLYGSAIVLFSNMLFVKNDTEAIRATTRPPSLWTNKLFWKLFTGLFLGTFAGLMVIGSLKLIETDLNICRNNLIAGIAFFAIANFAGRLIWGVLSDYIGARLCIAATLILQAAAIFLMGWADLNNKIFLFLVTLTGLGFGGNFVLFAKETSCRYGISNVRIIYPYVFLGYAVAGIAGPLFGSFLWEYFGNYRIALYWSAVVSLAGGLIFLKVKPYN